MLERMKVTEKVNGNQRDKEYSQMYIRIFNQLDAQALSDAINGNSIAEDKTLLTDRIRELAEILDENYGMHRLVRDMGGSIIFFPTEACYQNQIEKILKFYHLDKSVSEYEEIIGEKALGNTEWHEELWLLGSDDALVLIHPVEVSDV